MVMCGPPSSSNFSLEQILDEIEKLTTGDENVILLGDLNFDCMCGHNSSDSCDCWCEHYIHDGRQHLVEDCTHENCSLYHCDLCGNEKDEEDSHCGECREGNE